METFLALLGALLALALVPRPLLARALYVHDDSPAAGYVVAAGDDDLYRERGLAQKTRYVSSQKNMKLVNERAVDSYFKILRATPQDVAAAPGGGRGSPPRARLAADTEAPKLHQKQTETNTACVPRNDPRKQHRGNEKMTNQISKVKNDELPKPSRHEHFRKHNVHEKHAVVSSRGVKRNSRRPHRADLHHKLYNLSQVRDKARRRASARATGTSHTALIQNSPNAKDKEFSKRNAIDKESILQTIYEQNDNRLSSPKYVRVSDDAYQIGMRARRLGRHEAESEVSAPYALFPGLQHEHEAPPPDPRAALEESADGAYYRGSASSYVDPYFGRKPTPVL